jgi:MATE family multidrug resistance protein
MRENNLKKLSWCYKNYMKIAYHQLCKKTLLFVWPLIFANIANAAVGFTNMYFLSKSGSDSLAAGALISSTYAFFTTVAFSLLLPISILVSHAYGNKNPHEINIIIHQALIYAAIVSIPIIIILKCIYPVLMLFRQPLQAAKIVQVYFDIIPYSILPFLFNIVLCQFLIGIAKSKIIANFVILSYFLSTFLSYALMKGAYGLPNIGYKGIACSGVITSWASFVFLLMYLTSDQFAIYNFFPFKIYPSKLLIMKFFKMGFLISIQNSVEISSVMIMTYLIGSHGNAELIAQQIVLQCTIIPIMVVAAFSQAATVLIGQIKRKSCTTDVRRQHQIIQFLVMIFNALLLILFLVFPKNLISIFLQNSDPSSYPIINETIILLGIVGITRILDGIRSVALGALRAYSDVNFTLIVSLISYWVIPIPMACYLIFNYGAVGVRLSLLIGVLFCSCIFIFRFRKITAEQI